MFGDDFVEPLFQLQHVAHSDLHVAGGSFGAAQHLVDHDVRIRQGIALAFRAAAQQHRPHARRLADAVGVHVARQELHRVVNRQPGGHTAARGIDVKVDVLFRIGHLQKQQLGDDQVRDHVVQRRAQEYNSVHQQTRIDVIPALAPAGLLDDHRN